MKFSPAGAADVPRLLGLLAVKICLVVLVASGLMISEAEALDKVRIAVSNPNMQEAIKFLRDADSFGDAVQRVGRNPGERLQVAARPFHTKVDCRRSGQSKVCASRVLRPAMVGAVLDSKLPHSIGACINARADGIAFGLPADEIELDPVVRIAPVMAAISSPGAA